MKKRAVELSLGTSNKASLGGDENLRRLPWKPVSNEWEKQAQDGSMMKYIDA